MQKSLKWQSSVKRQKCVHAHTWRKLKESENIDQMINIMNEWREHSKVYRSKRLKTFLTGHVLTYLTVQKEVQLIWIRVWNNNVTFSRLWLIWAFTTAARCTVERKIERASLNSSDVRAGKNTRDGLLSQRSWLFFSLFEWLPCFDRWINWCSVWRVVRFLRATAQYKGHLPLVIIWSCLVRI